VLNLLHVLALQNTANNKSTLNTAQKLTWIQKTYDNNYAIKANVCKSETAQL